MRRLPCAVPIAVGVLLFGIHPGSAGRAFAADVPLPTVTKIEGDNQVVPLAGIANRHFNAQLGKLAVKVSDARGTPIAGAYVVFHCIPPPGTTCNTIVGGTEYANDAYIETDRDGVALTGLAADAPSVLIWGGAGPVGVDVRLVWPKGKEGEQHVMATFHGFVRPHIVGTYQWQTHCPPPAAGGTLELAGKFTITNQQANGTFGGAFSKSTPADWGEIVDGKITTSPGTSAVTFQFTRKGTTNQTWTGMIEQSGANVKLTAGLVRFPTCTMSASGTLL